MAETDNSLVETAVEDTSQSSSNKTPVPLPIAHFCFDIAFIFALFAVVEALILWTGPHKNGFFCTDQSIRLPYAIATVGLVSLIVYCVVLNLVVILCVELYRGIQKPNAIYSEYEQYRPKWAKIGIRFAIFFGYYVAFEVLINIITTCTKYPVGRLRPHFIDVCRPIIDGGRSIYMDEECKGIEEKFLIDYTCSGPSQAAITEARLSFFSGHSSLAMGASTYAILYLQHRLSGELGCRLLVPILQVICLSMGLFISYSRILDDWHHWSDVATGVFVGLITMFLMCRFVAKFFVHTAFDPPTCVRCEANSSTEAYSDNRPFVENF